MMSNVIAFPEPKSRRVTLFMHVRQVTLIAHITGRIAPAPVKDERVGKN